MADEVPEGALLSTALAVSPEAKKLIRACGFRTLRDLLRDPPVQLARELAMEPRKVVALVREIREAAQGTAVWQGATPTTMTSATAPSSSSSSSAGAAATSATAAASITRTAATVPNASTANRKRKGRSALELLAQEETGSKKIVTLCKSIDEMLDGGVSLGTLTEFCGVPGAGKTQVAMQLAVDVTIPPAFGGLGGECLYVDTEGSFTVERVVDMAEAVVRQLKRTAQASADAGDEDLAEMQARALKEIASAEDVLAKIHVCRVHNLVEQLSVAHCFADMLEDNPKLRLIVVDSVAFHFRQDAGTNAGQRARVLSGHAQLLNALAAERNLALVVTNQMTVKFDQAAPQRQSGDGASSYYAPALGEMWSHSVTNRVVLERTAEQTRSRPSSSSGDSKRARSTDSGPLAVRSARLVKSPYLAAAKASFQHLGLALPGSGSHVSDELVTALLDTALGHCLRSVDLVGNLQLCDPFPSLHDEAKVPAESWQKMQTLRMAHCLRLSKSSMLMIPALFPALRTLELACCLSVDDKVITMLCKELVHLRHVDIAGCSQVTDRGLANLTMSRGSQLVTLNLTGLWEISSRGLAGSVSEPQIWSCLEAFSCVGCTGLDDAAVLCILERCISSRLEVFHAAGVRSLSDKVLRVLESGKKLREVDMSDNPAVTTAGARELLKAQKCHTPGLDVFRARSCPLVSVSLVDEFPLIEVEVDQPIQMNAGDCKAAGRLLLTLGLAMGGSRLALNQMMGSVGVTLWFRGMQMLCALFGLYLSMAVLVFAVAMVF
ncbi:DNA repair protein RAD51-like 3 [Hondaea fermentalgiana]|uniref:DNA repair protein RAD51 homolog 3 n=1 Tax=Hondaea fermentalgiana TaxID=2315210 RepID=A0A2R5G069_9STRA|nr:DNA repair protein RAD51-like 3 [Hondaea fermentalgiana]|eukprot:GBG24390.1 DNA repair protein RAD51-like 3 [Hondaea fermentalgiana]